MLGDVWQKSCGCTLSHLVKSLGGVAHYCDLSLKSWILVGLLKYTQRLANHQVASQKQVSWVLQINCVAKLILLNRRSYSVSAFGGQNPQSRKLLGSYGNRVVTALDCVYKFDEMLVPVGGVTLRALASLEPIFSASGAAQKHLARISSIF